MGYDQFHALITAILLAGNFATGSTDIVTFKKCHDGDTLAGYTRIAEEIMVKCGFIRDKRGAR